jgi:predicted extracellular nuclease
VFLKPYAQYATDKGKEKYAADSEGIFVYRTKSSRNADGTPERVRLTTRAEVKEYCRQEQLMMPDEMNPNVTVGADGKTMDTHGLKGQWV